MTIKEIQPISFLFYRTQTTVGQLSNFFDITQELFAEASTNRLMISGPIHWHYFDYDGNEANPFTLEISLPVSQILEEYDGQFHFKRTETFKCVSVSHEGSWLDIPKSYGKAFGFINENNLQPLNVNREVYINVDFQNPAANTTEIQIGIK